VKRIFVLVMIVLLVGGLFTLSGCGSKKSDEAPGPKQDDQLKVALLLPGPISDQGWNASAYEGLKLIEKDFGAKIAFSESVPLSDIEEVFRGYALEGYNLIFGHGFEFGDGAEKVAAEFPNVNFVVTSTTIYKEPNLSSVKNDSLQQGFLAGIVAGLLTETNVVGSVGGMEIPPIVQYNIGFKLGAEYVNPDVTAITAMTGNFEDAAKAREMADAMIDRGADVITHDADQAGLGVIDAAKQHGIIAIGAIGDQYNLAPGTVVTSSLNLMPLTFEVVAKMMTEGTLEPKSYTFGVKEEVVALAPFRGWEDKVTDEFKQKIDEIVKDMADGKIDVWKMANLEMH